MPLRTSPRAAERSPQMGWRPPHNRGRRLQAPKPRRRPRKPSRHRAVASGPTSRGEAQGLRLTNPMKERRHSRYTCARVSRPRKREPLGDGGALTEGEPGAGGRRRRFPLLPARDGGPTSRRRTRRAERLPAGGSPGGFRSRSPVAARFRPSSDPSPRCGLSPRADDTQVGSRLTIGRRGCISGRSRWALTPHRSRPSDHARGALPSVEATAAAGPGRLTNN